MTITVYEIPTGCFGCKKTKELFNAAGVQFTRVDITTNDAARAYVNDLGYAKPRWWCTRGTAVRTTGPV